MKQKSDLLVIPSHSSVSQDFLVQESLSIAKCGGVAFITSYCIFLHYQSMSGCAPEAALGDAFSTLSRGAALSFCGQILILGASIALVKSFSCVVDMILRGGGFSEESLLV